MAGLQISEPPIRCEWLVEKSYEGRSNEGTGRSLTPIEELKSDSRRARAAPVWQLWDNVPNLKEKRRERILRAQRKQVLDTLGETPVVLETRGLDQSVLMYH
jgi:hypothetical protein